MKSPAARIRLFRIFSLFSYHTSVSFLYGLHCLKQNIALRRRGGDMTGTHKSRKQNLSEHSDWSLGIWLTTALTNQKVGFIKLDSELISRLSVEGNNEWQKWNQSIRALCDLLNVTQRRKVLQHMALLTGNGWFCNGTARWSTQIFYIVLLATF